MELGVCISDIGTRLQEVFHELNWCSWSMVVSGSRSTSLEEEEGIACNRILGDDQRQAWHDASRLRKREYEPGRHAGLT
ncbi:hypothetical protein Tco_1216253 [Tanacetum coccineum]